MRDNLCHVLRHDAEFYCLKINFILCNFTREIQMQILDVPARSRSGQASLERDLRNPSGQLPRGQALQKALQEIFEIKFNGLEAGWSPRLRQRFNYFTPDEWYEASISNLVTAGTVWLDVGCGRDVFPCNPQLAHRLSNRCQTMVGLDPCNNIQDNVFVHEKAQTTLEDFQTDRKFDLISLRMVAEHIEDPLGAAKALARLACTGGRVVVYTVSKYSLSSMIADWTPIEFHHWAKTMLWEADRRDTFPTIYRMNSRQELKNLFDEAGFVEESFVKLNDCRCFSRWRTSSIVELATEWFCRRTGIPYPETSIIGTYRKI
jgi:ubiquinone/menaquinone biosynthesis C-methylase UbiE